MKTVGWKKVSDNERWARNFNAASLSSFVLNFVDSRMHAAHKDGSSKTERIFPFGHADW